MEAETSGAAREISALQRYASRPAEMGVEAETDAATREVATLRRFASSGVSVSFEALTGAARGEVVRFRRDASGEVEVPVDANTDPASREIARLIQNISRQSAEIDVDTEQGREDLETLRQRAASLAARAFRLSVEAETDGARRELLALRSRALFLTRDLEMDVEVNTSPASRALAAFRDVQNSARRSMDRFNDAALFARNIGMVAFRAGVVSLIGTLAPLTGLAGIAASGLVSVGAGAGLLGAAAIPTASALEALAEEEGNVAKASKELGREILASEVALYQALTGFRESFMTAFEPARDVLNGILADAVGLGSQALPFLGSIATRTANALGRVFEELSGIITAPGQLGTFRDFFERIPQIFEDTASAAGKFAIGLFNILEVAQPFFGRFATYLDDIATRFLEWTQSAAAEEGITEFLENAVFFGKLLRDALVDVAKFLFEIGTSGGARNMAENLTLIIDALAQNTEGIEHALYLLGRLGDALVFILNIPGVGQGVTYLAGLLGTLALFGGGLMITAVSVLFAFRRALSPLSRLLRRTFGRGGALDDARRAAGRDLGRMTRSFTGWRAALRRAFLRVGAFFRPLTDALRALPVQAGRALTRLTNTIWRGVRGIPGLVRRGISGLGRLVARAFGGLGRIAARSLGSLASAVWRGVRSVPRLLWRGLSGLGRLVGRAFGGLGRIAGRALGSLASAVWRGVRSVPGLLRRGLSGLGMLVARAFGSLARIASRALGSLANTVWRGVRGIPGLVSRGFSGLGRTASRSLGWLASAVRGGLRGAGRWFSPLTGAVARIFGRGGWILGALGRFAGRRGLLSFFGPAGLVLEPFAYLTRWLSGWANRVGKRIGNALNLSWVAPWVMKQLGPFGQRLKRWMTADLGKLLWDGIKALGRWARDGFVWLGETIMYGWLQGIWDHAKDIYKALVEIGKSAWKAVKDFIRPGSPSKLFRELGATISQGLAAGIRDALPEVDAASREMNGRLGFRVPEMSISRPLPAASAGGHRMGRDFGGQLERHISRAVRSASVGEGRPAQFNIAFQVGEREWASKTIEVFEGHVRELARGRKGLPE